MPPTAPSGGVAEHEPDDERPEQEAQHDGEREQHRSGHERDATASIG